jgi:hypothetical protein
MAKVFDVDLEEVIARDSNRVEYSPAHVVESPLGLG